MESIQKTSMRPNGNEFKGSSYDFYVCERDIVTDSRLIIEDWSTLAIVVTFTTQNDLEYGLVTYKSTCLYKGKSYGIVVKMSEEMASQSYLTKKCIQDDRVSKFKRYLSPIIAEDRVRDNMIERVALLVERI